MFSARFLNKSEFSNENEYVEYINMYLITALATVLYTAYCIIFIMDTYNSVLIVSQIIGIAISISAFVVNRIKRKPFIATLIMIFLVCISINIWAYTLDVGNDLRWYALLALCPLYFFSSIVVRNKVILTVFVVISFLMATIISNYHNPLIYMPRAELFNTVSCCMILISIMLELIIYKVVNTKKEDELERIETILENIESGVIVVDKQTHEILDVNPVAARVYGYKKEDIIGKKCHSIICPEKEGSCPITDKGQTINREEQRFINVNGDLVPIIKTVANIRYNGRPALLESFTDITDIKKAEEKLRLLEITERANDAKSEFLSKMSHEMRTPLNAVIGMTQIAKGTDDVSKLRYCLSTIEVSSSHLLAIINDILDMSKIESGKLELNNEPIYIEDIIKKVCSLTTEKIYEKRLNLSVYILGGIDTRYISDELRLTQVIANIMSNAVKFTPDNGEITLTVEEAKKGSDHSIFRFTVTDTGIGMNDEQMDKLFNAFEQADGSITREFGGTGLGLAISKKIIEQMGGKIWVESQKGKGSRFIFDVKLIHISDDDGHWHPHTTLPPNTRILIAEPDREAREYLKSMLESHGAETIEIENTDELPASVKHARDKDRPFSSILLAYDWSSANGVDLVDKLDSDIDKSKIIMMTSFLNWNKIENHAREKGIIEFIPKPLFPSDVLKTVSNIMSGSKCKSDQDTVKEYSVSQLPDFSDITLLLAEDVELNREIFTGLLEDTNINVEIAENGVEAVSMFSENPERYDIIVMDIQMPLMNGYEATRQIRSKDNDRSNSIPIIAMSADAFKEDIEKCLACGMNDHMKKPIELDLIIETLRFYCNKKAASDS